MNHDQFVPGSILRFLRHLTLAATLACLAPGAGTWAATITVDTTADDPDPSTCSLREAVRSANQNTALGACTAGEAAPVVDVITLPAGTYLLELVGANENAAATGDLDVTEAATIQGVTAGTTIIDAQGIDRVFHVLGADLTLQDVTVQNGDNGGHGGGIRNSGGNLEAVRVVVRDNRAAGASGNFDGGGIANAAGGDSGGTVSVRDSTIQDNVSTDAGGGIFNGVEGVLDVIGSTITRNRGPDSGAGIRNQMGTTTVTDSVVSDNQTDDDGGGIRNNYGSFFVIDSIVSGNRAADESAAKVNHGGGLHNKDGGSLVVTDTAVQDNFAEDDGGGLRNDTGEVEIVGSTFSGNESPGAGGIRNNDTMSLTNSTVSGNSGSIGAGILNAADATLELSNVTLSDNSATTRAGGLRNTGTATLRNTIAAGNSAPLESDCSTGSVGVFVSDGYNLFGAGTGCAPIATDQTVLPADVFTQVLGPLQANGGLTHTHALLGGSPALDTGDPSGCVDDLGALLVTDQRGFDRPQDALGSGLRCDVGAYEQQPPTTTTSTTLLATTTTSVSTTSTTAAPTTSTTAAPTTSTTAAPITSPPTTSTTAAPTTTTLPIVKVAICHVRGAKKSRRRGGSPRYKTLSISSLSVADHLGHGDSLGPCSEPPGAAGVEPSAP